MLMLLGEGLMLLGDVPMLGEIDDEGLPDARVLFRSLRLVSLFTMSLVSFTDGIRGCHEASSLLMNLQGSRPSLLALARSHASASPLTIVCCAAFRASSGEGGKEGHFFLLLDAFLLGLPTEEIECSRERPEAGAQRVLACVVLFVATIVAIIVAIVNDALAMSKMDTPLRRNGLYYGYLPVTRICPE